MNIHICVFVYGVPSCRGTFEYLQIFALTNLYFIRIFLFEYMHNRVLFALRPYSDHFSGTVLIPIEKLPGGSRI